MLNNSYSHFKIYYIYIFDIIIPYFIFLEWNPFFLRTYFFLKRMSKIFLPTYKIIFSIDVLPNKICLCGGIINYRRNCFFMIPEKNLS